MSNTNKYGQFYWCVKSNLSGTGEIYFHADRIEVNGVGDMVAWSDAACDNPLKVLSIASGQWRCFFAASVIDGHAIACDHWAGEIAE